MELRFVVTESAFDYFDAIRSHLDRHGKPVAFYSDKHSIFRVHHDGATGRAKGVSQFGRALAELNIDIICANSPQAKGRVERMNGTLQDRLVKELRLQGISTMEDGNSFAPAFIEDYNARFGREPKNPHNAHRPLLPEEDLSRIFTWQEERTLTGNLVVHFKRVSYLVTPGPETIPLGSKRVQIRERENGDVEIWHGTKRLPYSVFDKNPTSARARSSKTSASESPWRSSRRSRPSGMRRDWPEGPDAAPEGAYPAGPREGEGASSRSPAGTRSADDEGVRDDEASRGRIPCQTARAKPP